MRKLVWSLYHICGVIQYVLHDQFLKKKNTYIVESKTMISSIVLTRAYFGWCPRMDKNCMGNVLLLLAYKYRKKLNPTSQISLEKRLKQKKPWKFKMVKVQVVKWEKSRISSQNNVEIKRKTQLFCFIKNIIQFNGVNYASSGMMIPLRSYDENYTENTE